MFGLFKSRSISEYAESAEILPVVEDGDYKAFVIQVLDSAKNFGAAVRGAGDKDAVAKFMAIIDQKIHLEKFENPFYSMFDELGAKPPVRNLNAERVVVCKGESGYVFKWTP